jgi:nicotinamidase/pyrazinamidase
MTVGILLVDPQYDFFPGGALAVPASDEIIAPINALLRKHPHAPLFASRDWHPPTTKHFKEHGGLWPPHCVQGTRGAAFHAGLDMQKARVFDKGTNPADDGGYSSFEAVREQDGRRIALLEDLKRYNVDALIVAGLATDHCVKASVVDALSNGIATFLYLPGVRAVEIEPGDGDRAIALMREKGALLAE